MDTLKLPMGDRGIAVEISIHDRNRVLARIVDTVSDKHHALAFAGCGSDEVWVYDDSLVAGVHVQLPPNRVEEAARWFAARGIEVIDERTVAEPAVH
ncbi:MAG: hypothetical protein LCH59_00780 [Proteobacteria bacterium]|nr:hypothetical protein [Pseudomonadota bacterium]